MLKLSCSISLCMLSLLVFNSSATAQNTHQLPRLIKENNCNKLFDALKHEHQLKVRPWPKLITAVNHCHSINEQRLNSEPTLPLEDKAEEAHSSTPAFTSFEISENEVEITDSPVTITGKVYADGSGARVSWGYLVLTPPDEAPLNHRRYIYMDEWSQTEENTYVADFSHVVDADHYVGEWSFSIEYIVDQDDNLLEDSISAAELEALGFNPYLDINHEYEVDILPPEFVSIEFSTNEVDVNDGPQSIFATITVSDESGIDSVFLDISPPTGIPSSHAKNLYLHEWSATDEPNTFSSQIVINMDDTFAQGDWTASIDGMHDTKLNYEYQTITTEGIEEQGFNATIAVANDNEIDVTPPEFAGIEFDTNTVNFANGTDKVTGRLQIYDESSTIDYAYLIVTPEEGSQSNQRKWIYVSRFEASSVPNTYISEFTIDFDNNDMDGVWSVSVSSIVDSANNYQNNNVTPSQLSALGLNPFLLKNISADSLPDLILNAQSPMVVDKNGKGTSTFTLSHSNFESSPSSTSIQFEVSDGLRFTTISFSGANSISNYCDIRNGLVNCDLNFGSDWETIETKIGFSGNARSQQNIKGTVELQQGEINVQNNTANNLIDIANFPATKTDYEGDGKANFAFKNIFSNTVYISNKTVNNNTRISFGRTTDQPVIGDFDGDGINDIAVYRATNQSWYVKSSITGTNTVTILGIANDDIPLVFDYDGDGITDFAVRNPSSKSWKILGSQTGTITTSSFGLQANDIPLPADYDGDGFADIAIRRPSTGVWYIQSSRDSTIRKISFGLKPSDVPVPADYDGDGMADVAIWRPSTGTWYIKQSSNQQMLVKRFGLNPKDVPVVADYDDDGRADIAVFRPENLTWYVLMSSTQEVYKESFGVFDESQPLATPVSMLMSKNETQISTALASDIMYKPALKPEDLQGFDLDETDMPIQYKETVSPAGKLP